ncbi:TlpA disulfide reductase family protein [uncultured Winogradskyella sp.]|uniref:TlpA family protein disulfide reductase n=1 Tax=uncultured Winogradskyella sp. TaxID=395353 RepID=UPI00262C2903|nr:TlpA disulfide reductase family protein [uncultured Winogradskyella sp.]
MAKGDTSPVFSYESVDGKIISLEDLKGKYVYIDVWATWCSPCIKQVPYLRVLEERYHNKNIVFVSISVDKEKVKDTWKQFIIDKQLGGIQLFADKSFDSDFMNAYAVNSIPRFILIDPEGKIIDSEAPRPSFEKTRVLLDELLN